MATYNVPFNLAFEETGASNNPYVLSNNTGQYPQIYLQSNGTYGVSRVNVSPFLNPASNGSTDAPTIYIKVGDTINVSPNNPGHSQVNQAITAGSSEPDPTTPTSWPVANQTTHTLVYPSNDPDLQTTWFYFGRPTTTPTSSIYTYSARVKIYVVKVGSLTLNGSTSTQTVAGSGGTLSVAANSIAGLKAAVGNTNNLYLHVRNSSNQVMFSNVSFFGATNPFLGKITTGTTSSTLTISSSLPAGTYTVNIGHFGGNGQGSGNSGNPFYGTDNIIASATFIKVANDTQPDSFSFTNPGLQDPSAIVTMPAFTVTGINAASPITLTGDGSPRVAIAGSATFSGLANQTINNNQTIQFQMDASSSYNTPHTARLNIGGTFADLTVTTIADPGGSIGGASTNATYGVQVFNAGSNEVFGPNMKVGNIVAQGSTTIPQGGSFTNPTPFTLPQGGATFEGFTSDNQDDIDIIVLYDMVHNQGVAPSMQRGDGSNGASEGQVIFSSPFNSAIGITYYVIRTS
tara:strand:+ start:39 stop:1586 length:1548 start_codon:yes stop_codon:yes gene_type:complete